MMDGIDMFEMYMNTVIAQPITVVNDDYVIVPDVIRRTTWILVARVLDVFPQEIVDMIGSYLTDRRFVCSNKKCSLLFALTLEGMRYCRGDQFCSDGCHDEQHLRIPRDANIFVRRMVDYDAFLRRAPGRMPYIFRHTPPPPPVVPPPRRVNVQALAIKCKTCKKDIAVGYKKDGNYCGRSCFQKRWKK